ncbi:MAG TPA: hypothetical protein VKD25_01280 [Burkholderiales bacterium]|nr:hypothetical protein [Burkholderiales bacterium]
MNEAVRRKDMLPLLSAGLLVLLATAGCAPFERASPPAAGVEADAPKKPLAEAQGAPTPAPEVKPAAPEPAAPPAAPPPADTPATRTVEPAAPATPPGAEKPAAKAPAEPAPKKQTAAAPAQPPLDLNALEKRLKDTDAIGVFTKLTLKNQVDDLLAQFEAHHGGANRTSLAALRQPYDLLIIKVLSLLQDRDARLANDLVQSREAIWSILSDPAKFQRLVNENRS